MQGGLLIGVDIGTSSVKAVLLGADGARLDAYGAPYPTRRPGPGRVEQDPRDWLAHVTAALDQFAAHPLAAQVAAIGVTSQVNTHVFCDRALAPLMPAITWADGRAAAEAAALDTQLEPDAKAAALGAPIPIDASHALARMAWVGAQMPDVWARTAHVLLPKDFVIARLTGRVVADPISAVGLVGTDHAYAGTVLALLDGAAARLAALADPLAVVGPVVAGQPFAGVPVVCGTMDAWASMFGVGVAAEGQVMHLCGTSDVLGLISDRHAPTPGVITFPPWRGIRLHAAPTQAGGAALAWLAGVMEAPPEALAELAADAPITAQSPLFLPHLEGERAPLWDSATRGTFAGLSGRSGRAEMVAAVLEGVAFSARMALEAVEASGQHRAARLHIGGGGAASGVWRQIRANALGRPLLRMGAGEPGALGAAVMAGVGAGLIPDLVAAVGQLVTESGETLPDAAACALANDRFALFQQLYRDARAVNAALSGADAGGG